jgi:hypothetical protein
LIIVFVFNIAWRKMSHRMWPKIRTRRKGLKMERAEFFMEEEGGILDRRPA